MALAPNTRMVVLDDDPTGIQTVHGCKLLTTWDEESVRHALADGANGGARFFYILTNTRAMTPSEAKTVVADAMLTVLRANKPLGYKLLFISRSDSCLRGHFPLETDVMRSVLEANGIQVWHPTPFVPAFIEAGRVTIGGSHFMKDGNTLTPLSKSEFSRDNVFGYTTSVLTEYIREKGANPDDYEIVDAQSYEELYTFTNDLLQRTEGFDGAVVIRSSSSLPKALSGIKNKALLDRNILTHDSGTGCFVVGSHVQKTTRQLYSLLEAEGTTGIEIDVENLINAPKEEITKTLQKTTDASECGQTPVIYTSRKEIRLADAGARQHLGQHVSAMLVELVRRLPFSPLYLVAKGGITSHDILTKGLGVREATVLGQIVPNVPCVMAGDMPYVIFPGNVGGEDSLREVYDKLKTPLRVLRD